MIKDKENCTLYSNEIVFRGHPDKVCDQISAAILKECIKQDKETHAGIEVCGGKGKIFVTGEITTRAKYDLNKIVKRVLRDVGYDEDAYEIIDNIGLQSPDINQGVSKENDIGAGDQGLMFGFVCKDTMQLLRTAQVILQKLAIKYDKLRETDYRFLPDGKAQITGYYDKDFNLVGIKDFVISYQNTEKDRPITDDIIRKMVNDICDYYFLEIENIYINPTGKFLIGGFEGDAGLTGRKIVVDAYQSFANVGGGCVDRDTEYLTPMGWRKICDFENTDLVAQWVDGNLEFVKPINYIKKPKERMFRVSNQTSLDMVLSENHNVLYRKQKTKKLEKSKMLDIYNHHFSLKQGNRIDIPVFFKYNFKNNSGINLTDDEIRLQVAFCADGTILNKKWNGRIRILKRYKIQNIEKLLIATGYDYICKKDGQFSIYYFNPPIKSKSLFNCFYNCNEHQMNVLSNEIFNWDGNRKDLFRTTIKQDADFIQFVLSSVSGKRVSLCKDDRRGESYGKYIRKSIAYSVEQLNTTYTGLRRNKQLNKSTTIMEEFKSDDPYMYCINVPSHNLVLRRNDRIFITGNCMNGKDPSKVDFSAAHKARELAKRFLFEYNLRWCEVQLSYAIGLTEPFAIYVRSDKGIIKDIPESVYAECTPKRMIEDLDLLNADFEELAKFGHFVK